MRDNPTLLVVAATKHEVKPLLRILGMPEREVNRETIYGGAEGSYKDLDIKVEYIGVGAVSMATYLTLALMQDSYDFVLNIGVAGSYKRELALGMVVEVASDCFADMGAEDNHNFLDMKALNLPLFYDFSDEKNPKPVFNVVNNKYAGLSKLPLVQAITSNTVHGNSQSIEAMRKRWNPDIETMEGAAFFQVCMAMELPHIALRGISNYVEPRNRAAWQLDKAIESVNQAAFSFIKSYADKPFIQYLS